MERKHVQLDLIQIFRGIAALIVVVHHSTVQMLNNTGYHYLENVFTVGWFGVDLFFVLSGFIIVYIHYYDLGRKDKLRKYALKRVTRIYPAYWIITLILIPLFIIVPSWGQDYVRDPLYIVKSLFLVPQSNAPLLGVGWTLIHELFFYLMFGLFIYCRRPVSITIGSVWFLGTVLGVTGLMEYQHYLLKLIFSNYNIEFLLGSIIALCFIKGNVSIRTAWSSLIAGILILAMGWWGALEKVFIKGDVDTVLVFGVSGALIIFGLTGLNIYKAVKTPKPLLFLGDASYSIYLSHFYVIIFLEKITTKFSGINPFNSFVTTTAIVILAIVSGSAFYQIIEKPLLIKIKQYIFSNKNLKTNQKRNIV